MHQAQGSAVGIAPLVHVLQAGGRPRARGSGPPPRRSARPVRRAARMIARRSWPWTYSITKNGSSRSSPMSVTWTMFGWSKVAASRASRRNISTNSRSSARWGSTSLRTTSFSNPWMPRARARYSSAIPPRASRRTSVKRPNRRPAADVVADPSILRPWYRMAAAATIRGELTVGAGAAGERVEPSRCPSMRC